VTEGVAIAIRAPRETKGADTRASASGKFAIPPLGTIAQQSALLRQVIYLRTLCDRIAQGAGTTSPGIYEAVREEKQR